MRKEEKKKYEALVIDWWTVAWLPPCNNSTEIIILRITTLQRNWIRAKIKYKLCEYYVDSLTFLFVLLHFVFFYLNNKFNSAIVFRVTHLPKTSVHNIICNGKRYKSKIKIYMQCIVSAAITFFLSKILALISESLNEFVVIASLQFSFLIRICRQLLKCIKLCAWVCICAVWVSLY